MARTVSAPSLLAVHLPMGQLNCCVLWREEERVQAEAGTPH